MASLYSVSEKNIQLLGPVSKKICFAIPLKLNSISLSKGEKAHLDCGNHIETLKCLLVLLLSVILVTLSDCPHSSILSWRIPCTEEPDRPQSIASQRVGKSILMELNLLFCGS